MKIFKERIYINLTSESKTITDDAGLHMLTKMEGELIKREGNFRSATLTVHILSAATMKKRRRRGR